MIGRPLGAVVLLGLPGAGKTTLAEGLAQQLGARLVSRDEIRCCMFRPCSFTDAEKATAFSALIDAVRTNCVLGQLSIVEGMPFSRRRLRTRQGGVAAAAQGRSVMAILLKIEPAVAAQRIAAQGSPQRAVAADRDKTLPFAVDARSVSLLGPRSSSMRARIDLSCSAPRSSRSPRSAPMTFLMNERRPAP